MEKAKVETLKPSMREGTPFVFPPHRRSHLKSETFRTLVRILSHCIDESQNSPALQIVPEAAKPGIDSDQIGQTTQKGVCGNLVGPDDLGPENLPIQEDPIIDKSTEVIGIQDGSFSQEQIVTDELEHRMRIDGDEELVCGDSLKPSISSVEKYPTVNEVVSLIDDQCGLFSLEHILIDESEQPTLLTDDNKDLNCKTLEAMNLSLDKELINEDFKSSEDNQDRNSSLERNVVEELDNVMQQKEMDLMNLVSSNSIMDSSVSLTADREIEDGEISDDSGISNQPIDLFLEDALVYEERKDVKERKRKDMEDKPNILVYSKTRKVKKAYGDDSMLEAGINKRQDNGAKGDVNCSVSRPNNLGFHGEISEKIVTENQRIKTLGHDTILHDTTLLGMCLYHVMDVEVCDKRKRGPESKEKKKLKEKKRRAKKNKLLGVKRLKLQPILKPKQVKYCDHYLKGRCQKGDLCTFSHDTIPLTKSQPCSYFARHSCMKGDDCPFDHQLSKYPCNNYMSKGFCSRGDNCMFSHNMPLKDGSSSESNLSKLDLQSPLLENINSRQHLTNFPQGKPDQRKPEQNMAEMLRKPPAQAPKGMNFLSFGKAHLDDSSKRQQGDVIPKMDDGNKLCNQKNQSVSDKLHDSNEMPWKTPTTLAPVGLNFIRFGKAPLDDSSKQKQADLPSKRDCGTGICIEKSQSASDKLQSSNTMSWRKPASPHPLCQSSNPLADGHNKHTPSSAKKALMSTLAFAAKYESEMKTGLSIRTPAVSAEADRASRISSSFRSGSLQDESMKASKILEDFLHGVGNKGNQ
ncbi:hypothetical protein HHK36_014317 [Tetracentron sinense]|uniref:C3H1-type domain-containing protein n=1 Tax=Tetracentron sinense TaxID=13715 RepID=A0A835DI74_TETSI|nr:hypothetical protein HHK36_014317 [Tetracentron sinense]